MIAEGEVTIYEAHAIAVGFEDLHHGRVGSLAIRGLEVRELDNLDRRVRRTLHRALGCRDVLPRGFEQDPHRRFGLQRIEELVANELHPLLRQVLANWLANLIE